MVRLPPPQEFGGQDLAEKCPGVPDDAHLDVPLLQQLVPHAVAVDSPPAQRGPHFRPFRRRHFGQQRLALLELPVVASPAAAAVHIHGSSSEVRPARLEARLPPPTPTSPSPAAHLAGGAWGGAAAAWSLLPRSPWRFKKGYQKTRTYKPV
ncbi:UNVERIFIED_CONTAM: hypothetical protein K2H54_047580 [Gekko kuhli]